MLACFAVLSEAQGKERLELQGGQDELPKLWAEKLASEQGENTRGPKEGFV